jgi:hypothetical protein
MLPMRPLTTLLLLLASLPGAALAAEIGPEALAGLYRGEVFNNVDMDAVTTTFRFEADGRLTGTYEVDEEEGAFKGRISNVRFEGPYTISFEWTDKFGEGFATVEFARDFASFTGEWTDKLGQTGGQPWTGRKQGSVP